MAATVLPRITSSFKADDTQRHWTPAPAYCNSQRDPIVGTVRPYQHAHQQNNRPSNSRQKTLPDIYQRNFNKNSRYEARVLILVDKKTGQKIKFPKMGKRSAAAKGSSDDENEENRPARSFNRSIHERSIFEDTGHTSSYFIIHPDWTSEVNGIRNMSAKVKTHHSWDSRPPVHPLSSYIEPLMEKRRLRDQYIKAMDQAKHIEAFHARAESRAQSQRRQRNPVTPKDSEGRYKGFSMY